jgi:hypothetical protein
LANKPGIASDVITSQKEQIPQAGDIYLVVPGKLGTGTNRLCAVLEVDSSMKAARVALVTNEIEYECDWDVRMSREELNLSYDLMMECDLVSSVWWNQLTNRLGSIAKTLWPRLLEAATTGNFSEVEESRRGTPIHGRSDPRWAFREQELRALHALSAECMTRLVDGLVLDPELIAVLARSDRDGQHAIVAAVSERVVRETVRIDVGSLDLFFSVPGSIDPDAWNALQPLIESATGSYIPTSSKRFHLESPSLNPEAHRAITQAFGSLLTNCLLAGISIAHVLTHHDAWQPRADVFQLRSDETPPLTLVAEMLR